MKDNRFNFTEKSIASLPIPKKSATYYDSGSTDGLCLIVTYGGTKTYYSYIKFQGTPKRTKIGRITLWKLVDARKKLCISSYYPQPLVHRNKVLGFLSKIYYL